MSTTVHVELIDPPPDIRFPGWPAVLWVERLNRDDPSQRVNRVWNPYLTPPDWQWNPSRSYAAQWDPHHQDESWGYVFSFANGERGTCRVRDIEVALGALGYRVSMEGDA